MTRARSTFAELTADCDMDIDDGKTTTTRLVREELKQAIANKEQALQLSINVLGESD